MLLLRLSMAHDDARLARDASATRAAVVSAIANAVWGKETPEFDLMIARMTGAEQADGADGAITSQQALEANMIQRGPGHAVTDEMQEF